MNDDPFFNPLIPNPLTPNPVTPNPLMPDPLIPNQLLPDPSTLNLIMPNEVTPNPLTPDQLNRFSEEVSLNSSQITINQEFANQSAGLWVEQKTNLFMQTLAKFDQSVDNAIVSILGSITDDIK